MAEVGILLRKCLGATDSDVNCWAAMFGVSQLSLVIGHGRFGWNSQDRRRCCGHQVADHAETPAADGVGVSECVRAISAARCAQQKPEATPRYP